MDSSKSEVAYEFPPFYRVYKDGHVERFIGTDVVLPSIDPHTGVSSKDIICVPETGVSARLYLPEITSPHQKLPFLLYFHGGAFCVETAFSPTYHHYLNTLVAKANVVAVSVNYRRVPEHPLPIAYEDSWAVVQWVSTHCKDEGASEPWLRDHVDFGRVFLAGDSVGANIAHNLAMRAGSIDALAGGMKIHGIALIHPYFWGKERLRSEETTDPYKKLLAENIWVNACPSAADDKDDPRVNPVAGGAEKLSGLGCRKVLVCVAEKDLLKDRGWLYYKELVNSGWDGVVEIMETEEEDHVFHLFNPSSEKAADMMKRLASFHN